MKEFKFFFLSFHSETLLPADSKGHFCCSITGLCSAKVHLTVVSLFTEVMHFFNSNLGLFWIIRTILKFWNTIDFVFPYSVWIVCYKAQFDTVHLAGGWLMPDWSHWLSDSLWLVVTAILIIPHEQLVWEREWEQHPRISEAAALIALTTPVTMVLKCGLELCGLCV